jgi:hypothetical protein
MSHSKLTKRGFSLYIEKWNPSAKKYVCTCSICGRQGYNPAVLEKDFHGNSPDKNYPCAASEEWVIYQELTKTLASLELDDYGRCDICTVVHEKMSSNN